jgi:hypothetical protein
MLFAVALFINVNDVSAANSTFNTTSVVNSADIVRNNVETNHTVPNTIKVADQDTTSAQYLYLLSSAVININKGNTTPVTLKNVSAPTNPSETIISGSLTKTEYLSIANKIVTFVNTNGRLPNYVSTSLGNMRYENLVYYYSKILSFYKTNNRLPNTVAVKPWNTLSNTSNTTNTTTSNLTLDQILKTAAKFGYSSVAHDAAGIIKYGSGDCWAMSDYLFKQLSAAGIKARVVQYPTSYSSNHRSVQLYQNGVWIDVPYREYGFNMLFNNTSGSKSGTVIASN